jgi:hypothetical protein
MLLPLTLNFHSLHSVLTKVAPSPLLLTGPPPPPPPRYIHQGLSAESQQEKADRKYPCVVTQSRDVTAKVSPKTDDIRDDRAHFGFSSVPVRTCPLNSLLPCGRKLLCSFASSDAHCFGDRPSRLFIRRRDATRCSATR